MSLIDRIFAGRVIKDFGVIEKKSYFLGGMTKSILLIERRGEPVLAVKDFIWFLFSIGVHYDSYEWPQVMRLREVITESENIIRNLPPSTYDVAVDHRRKTLIVLLVAAVITILAQDRIFVIFFGCVALMALGLMYRDFRRYVERRPEIWRTFLAAIAAALVLTVAKLAWLAVFVPRSQ